MNTSPLHKMISDAARIGPDGHPLAPTKVEDDPWFKLIEDAATIAERELPPPVEIVQGLVCEQSKLLICSGSKSFKTWLLMHLSLCISHYLALWNRATTRRRVLYVNLELRAQTFERRLQTLVHAMRLQIDRSWFLHLPLRGHLHGASLHDILSRLLRFATHFDVGVIAIDPLYKLNFEGEENNSRDQTLLFNQLDRLTTEACCTLLLNDHSGKGNQSQKDDPLDVIRGSSAKGGDIDVGMVLRKHKAKDCFRVDIVHRELPPVDPFVIGWEYPLFKLRTDLDSADMKKPNSGRKRTCDPRLLVAAISEVTKERAISISAWADKAGIPRQTLTDYLRQIRANGWIDTVGEGNNARQYLTKEGQKVARSVRRAA